MNFLRMKSIHVSKMLISSFNHIQKKLGYFSSPYDRLSSLKSRFHNIQLKIIEYNTCNKKDDQRLEVENYQMLIDDLIFNMQENYNKIMSTCTTNNANN